MGESPRAGYGRCPLSAGVSDTDVVCWWIRVACKVGLRGIRDPAGSQGSFRGAGESAERDTTWRGAF